MVKKTHISSNPDAMRMELEERRFDNGGAAFGVFPQMKPRRSARSDVDPNVAIPRGLARGFVSGVAGAPGDLEGLARLLLNVQGPEKFVMPRSKDEAMQMLGQVFGANRVGLETVLPTSEDVEKALPFRGNSPMERAATGLAQIGGSFYTGPGAPIRLAGAIPEAVGKAGRDFVMAAGQPAVNVVKPKGGNWLTGSIEKKLKDIKVKYPSATFDEPEKNFAILVRDHGPEGAEEILRAGAYRYPLIKEDMALNQWIDKTLGKYIKNEMGTPTDPVRLAMEKKFGEVEAKFEKDMARSQRTAERAAQETDPRRRGNLERQAERESLEAKQERRLGLDNIYNIPLNDYGFPSWSEAKFNRTNAARFSGPEYGSPMAANPAGESWEIASDALIGTSPAGTRRVFQDQLKSSPWLADIDPNAAVHQLGSPRSESILGFDHVIDILRQDLAAGRIKPQDLNKLTVDQAVLRTGEYDKELARARLEQQVKSTEGFPVHKDYPEQGYKWYELALGDLPPGYTRDASGLYVDPQGQRSIHHPNYGRLEDALKYEGNMLEHCVGGYCDDVVSGNSRIYSLRNQAGEPFATVEVQPWDQMLSGEGLMERFGDKGKKIWESYRGKIAETGQEPGLHAFIRQNYPEVYKELDVPSIVQIKGRKNRAPDPAVLPYVQDFVRSGNWSEIGDLQNAGLYRVTPGQRLPGFSKEIPPGYYSLDDFQKMAAENEMPQEILDSWMSKLQSPYDYKRGGRVHVSDNLDTMRMELADKKMAGGGLSKALKEVLKPLPRAAAKTKPEIEAIAERMAPQVLGEYVREKPKSAVTVAGKTRKQFEREKELPVDVRGEVKTPEIVDVEKLKGNVVIGIPGDPTITDRALHGVGGVRLESASPQHGGPLYGLGRPDFWASGIGPATRVQNLAAEVAEQYGAPVLGKYVMMGPESINYAQHFADANLQAIDLSRMTRAQVEGFNNLIRQGSPKSGPRPSFPGIEDKESAYLHLAFDPELRKHFNAVMQQPKVTEAFNLPSGQDIRFAITEPALRNLETGVTGYSLGRMKPGEGLKLSEHPTYSHDIPGEFMGQSRYPMPYELSFPDTLAAVRANPAQAPQEFGSLKMVGPRQIVDQQMIDEIRAYEEAMKRLTGKKKGGVVKLAAGGLSKAAAEALTKMRSLSKEFAEKSAEYARYTQETKNVPTRELPSFEEWKALQINATPQNIEQLRKETGNKRGGSIKKKR